MSPMASSQVQHSAFGFIHTVEDAQRIVIGAANGNIPCITHRIPSKERKNLIISGAIFVYRDGCGFSRWTDGLHWSPSRIHNRFLFYRELHHGLTQRERNALRNGFPPEYRVGNSHNRSQPFLGGPLGHTSTIEGLDLTYENPRDVMASLYSDSPDDKPFQPDGMLKKTINMAYRGQNWHVVSYYRLSDLRSLALWWVMDYHDDLRSISLLNSRPVVTNSGTPSRSRSSPTSSSGPSTRETSGASSSPSAAEVMAPNSATTTTMTATAAAAAAAATTTTTFSTDVAATTMTATDAVAVTIPTSILDAAAPTAVAVAAAAPTSFPDVPVVPLLATTVTLPATTLTDTALELPAQDFAPKVSYLDALQPTGETDASAPLTFDLSQDWDPLFDMNLLADLSGIAPGEQQIFTLPTPSHNEPPAPTSASDPYYLEMSDFIDFSMFDENDI